MNLQKLQTQREANRKTIDRYVEKLEEAKEQNLRTEFNTTFRLLEKKVSALESLNEKILGQIDLENMETEILETDEYTLNLELKLEVLKQYREEQRSNQEPRDLPVSEELYTQSTHIDHLPSNPVPSISSNASQFYRLPKLNLPTFSGDILKWQTFWDSFESTVHYNANLTDVQKFSYLQSQLEGDAASTVEGFPLTNCNYTKAVCLLKERFGQTHKIKHAYMQSLIQLPTPTTSIYSLRSFYDKMESYIRGLESLGLCEESFGSLLVPVVIDKLPGDIRRQLARQHSDGDWSLRELRGAIFREINIIEAGLPKERSLPEGMYTASFHTGTRRNESVINSHKIRHVPNRYTKKCIFCDDNHFENECTKVTDRTARVAIVKRKKLCFNCLGSHLVTDCRNNHRCRNCKRKHHSSICDKPKNDTQVHQTLTSTNLDMSRDQGTVLHSSTTKQHTPVLLKTAVAEVRSETCCVSANILFDEGAQRSFVSEKLAKDLQLRPDGYDVINLSTFGDNNRNVKYLPTATLCVITDKKELIPIKVLIVPIIATPLSNKYTCNAAELPYIRHLKLAHPVSSNEAFEITLLIGADYYWDIVQDKVIRGSGPTAVESKVGYLLSGPLPATEACVSSEHVQTVIAAHIQDECLQKFWNLESMGISSDKSSDTAENVQFYRENCIRFSDGKYEAKLPWKQEQMTLPSNYNVTKKRTESTIRRLMKEPDVLKKYGEIMADQVKRGFIERVDCSPETQHPVHYIPHHPVKKNSTTTPIRIVFDCSCRESQDQPSLNDCLESTPPELNDITSLLLRFRSHRYAVSTDIEKAFLHIGLDENDRDVTRFLWFTNPTDFSSPLTTYRFKVVLFGATCSPFILNATIMKHLEENSHVPAAKILLRDLYVDNIVSSFETEKEVVSYFRESRDLMAAAGFNLRAWASNCIPLRQVAKSEGVIDSEPVAKILGMMWNSENDTLEYTRHSFLLPEIVTKRLVLQQSSKIFDPLGFLGPITVRAKLLIQDLWKGKFEWDAPLPNKLKRTWSAIAQDLTSVTQTIIPRSHFQETEVSPATEENILHVFVDASIRAYGAVAYLQNRNMATLVMSKNRVSPLKEVTLPRLELLAAVIGARLASHVLQSIPVSKTYLWSDSQIVLHWLRSTKPLKRFVKNRVTEISQLTRDASWNYCPTADNPADHLTRGLSAANLQENALWWNGPIWMCDKASWPRTDFNNYTDSVLSCETDDIAPTNMDNFVRTEQHTGLLSVIDSSRYSTFKKLLRVTAYVLRFLYNCRRLLNKRILKDLQVQELENAEKVLIASCQTATYSAEIQNIKSKATRLPLVRQLRLFLDQNGLIRCGGRIHNAPLDENAKFPLLLPNKHPLCRLIVQNVHREQLHTGVNGTVTQLRQKYWIPSIRQCVSAEIRKCVVCRKVTGKAYSAPDPPPMPSCRLNEAPPFSVTGVDFTGALFVRDSTGRESKTYICLFTCASTRAVHLEIVSDLSEHSFIQALRRFVSRRSCPITMVSDNASTYLAASNYIKKLFESQALANVLNEKGITWKFIPKRAPWYGGWWERLVGITKTTIKKVLGRAYVTLEMLQTVVTEVEAMMNDRPLTYVSSSLSDPEPLTPSHLLYGRRLTSLPYQRPDVNAEDIPMTHMSASRRHKQQLELLDRYWSRWRNEYLTALREQHTTTGNNSSSVKTGDVVLVHDDLPRSKWKLAVIEDVMTGKDGLVRAATIRTTSGITTRPIVKLYPLEVNSQTSNNCV